MSFFFLPLPVSRWLGLSFGFASPHLPRERPGAVLVSPSPCKGKRREGCADHVTGLRPAPSARVGLRAVRLRSRRRVGWP